MKDRGDIFARLLVTHDRPLRRYIAMLLLRHDDIEEVLQRTAVVLWQKFEEYDQSRDFLPWATRVAYYEVLNLRKEHARSRLVYTEDVMQALTETREQCSEELQNRRTALQHCLTKISDGDRQLLHRRYGDSSTAKTLAEETGQTIKAVYRRMDRIRAAVTKCVDRQVALER